MPGAVEGKDIREPKRRAVTIQLQERGPQEPRIAPADPDEVHRVRLHSEPEALKRPELQRLLG